jgi:hypothetical protein
MMTGFLEADSAFSIWLSAASPTEGRAGRAAGGGSTAISCSRYSVGTETNTGPRGALAASWQARCMVEASSVGTLSAKLHFTQDSISRAGPPRSVSRRSHCRPTLGEGGSPKPITSPARITIGMRSCSAARAIIVVCSAPTVVCTTTAGSLPVALA